MVIAMSVGACAGRPRERARRPSGNRSRYPPLLRSSPGPAASCRGTRWTPRVFLLYGTNAAHRLHRAVRGDREDPPASWLVTDARPKPLGSPVPPVGLRPIESSSSGRFRPAVAGRYRGESHEISERLRQVGWRATDHPGGFEPAGERWQVRHSPARGLLWPFSQQSGRFAWTGEKTDTPARGRPRPSP